MIRGHGYVRDVLDRRDFSFSKMMGSAMNNTLPDVINLTKHVDKVRDQGATESCVGQTFARMLHMRAGIKGVSLAFPSALAIYAAARAEDASRGAALFDLGCRPRQAVQGMLDVGFCGEELWPFRSERVNEFPPWDVLALSGDGRSLWQGSYYKILTEGDARVIEVRRALAAGYPVGLGVAVDTRFHDYGPSSEALPPPRDNEIRGMHMLTLTGFRGTPTGYVFHGVNSWGTSWGQGGLFWASDAWLRDSLVSDVYVVTLDANEESGAR